MKQNKINPHCSVKGCRTIQPHADDPIAKGLIGEFSPPDNLTFWVLHGMAELRDSFAETSRPKRYLRVPHSFAFFADEWVFLAI
jgi:hypothetical protein